MNSDIQKNIFVVHERAGFFDFFVNFRVFPFFMACCALILLLIPQIFLEMTSGTATWLTFLVLVILSVVAWRQVRSMGENPWISPLFLYLAVILTFETALGILFLHYGALLSDIAGWNPEGFILLRDSLPKASWLTLLSAFGAYIGLAFPIRPLRLLTGWLPALGWTIDEKRFPFRAGMAVPIIVTCFYLAARPGILPASLQQIAYSIGQCGIVLFIAGMLQILTEKKTAKLWKIILVSWWICYTPFVFLGIRSILIWPIVYFIWAHFAVKKRLNRKVIVLFLLLALILVSVVFPFFVSYKALLFSGEKLGISEAELIASDIMTAQKDISVLGPFLEFLRVQALPGTNVANYIQHYPDSIPYLKGESIFIVMSEMIPRFLYPDKPNVWLYINKLSYDIGMGHSRSLETSSMFIDAISEFYINFGPVGVFLFSILQGIFLQVRYDWLIRRSNLSLGFPVYAAAFLGSGAFWHVLVLDSKNFIVWIVFLWLLSRPGRRRV